MNDPQGANANYFCVGFNADDLKQRGLNDEQIEAFKKLPESERFDAEIIEGALLPNQAMEEALANYLETLPSQEWVSADEDNE